jgi:hypothetical protein
LEQFFLPKGTKIAFALGWRIKLRAKKFYNVGHGSTFVEPVLWWISGLEKRKMLQEMVIV